MKIRKIILDFLEERIKETKVHIENYEENEVYELAYLIKWQVFEKTVKEIAKIQRKENLIEKVNQWKEYLENNSGNKPADIKNFSIDSEKLPELNLINQFLGDNRLVIEELLDSKGKYRIKRNKIAHNFEKIAKQETYEEYSKKLDEGIKEIKTLLETI